MATAPNIFTNQGTAVTAANGSEGMVATHRPRHVHGRGCGCYHCQSVSDPQYKQAEFYSLFENYFLNSKIGSSTGLEDSALMLLFTNADLGSVMTAAEEKNHCEPCNPDKVKAYRDPADEREAA